MAHPLSPISWHLNRLPRATQKALNFLRDQGWLQKSAWYLAGGTALTLQFGHRTSFDLDFFLAKKDFSTVRLLDHFKHEPWTTTLVKEGTIYGELGGAKISFISYPFFVPARPPHRYGNVRVLDARDIAVMKIVAISQRGRKRDFVDLYWYVMHQERLADIFWRLHKQYPTVKHNYFHILESFTYFADADVDAMPKIFFKASWEEIKKFFRREVKKVAEELYLK